MDKIFCEECGEEIVPSEPRHIRPSGRAVHLMCITVRDAEESRCAARDREEQEEK